MKPAELQFTLRQLPEHLKDVLDDSARRVVEQAAASLDTVIDKFRGKPKKKLKNLSSWSFRIDRGEPLRFTPNTVRGYRVQVDLFCETRWPADPNANLESHTMGVRVWALEKAICFRPDWDAAGIEPQLPKSCRRVIMRWHFDQDNPGQDGPTHHLQIGGVPEGGEFCWLHSFLSVPRFACAPTDLVLACDLITANFYPDVFERIRKEPGWRALVQKSQAEFQEAYYSECEEVISHGDSLLDALWNR
jgi:hypothetical protein